MLVVFFFFQAEDGIRDIGVTGVQTCALPICSMPNAMFTVTRYPVISPSETSAWLDTTSTPVMPRMVCDAVLTASRTASENDLSDDPMSWMTFAVLATATSLFGCKE